MTLKDKTLTEEFLEEKKPQIFGTFENFGVPEEEYEAELEHFKENYEEVLKRRSAKVLSREILFEKALGKTMAKKDSLRGGTRFDVLILRYTEPRDWNAEEVENILKAWQSGPKARHNLIESEKVAWVKKGVEKIVLSKIDKYEISKETKRFVPISGKEIEEGELPIPIDTREKTAGGGENRNQTFPLKENWSLTIFGLAEVKDGYTPFNFVVYDNDYANPNSDKFLPKLAPAFEEYKIVGSVDEDRTKKTKGGCLFLRYFKGISKIKEISINPDTEKPYTPEEKIYILMDNGFIKSYKLFKGKTAEYPFGPYLIDMGDLREFHDEYIAQKDKDGNIKKTPSGYDKTHFDRYGISIPQCSDKTETKNGNFRLKFMDYSGKSGQAFTSEHIDEPPFAVDLPQDAIISFKSDKKPTRWDWENQVSVEDPINGDVTLGTLMDVKPLKHILDEE